MQFFASIKKLLAYRPNISVGCTINISGLNYLLYNLIIGIYVMSINTHMLNKFNKCVRDR